MGILRSFKVANLFVYRAEEPLYPKINTRSTQIEGTDGVEVVDTYMYGQSKVQQRKTEPAWLGFELVWSELGIHRQSQELYYFSAIQSHLSLEKGNFAIFGNICFDNNLS